MNLQLNDLEKHKRPISVFKDAFNFPAKFIRGHIFNLVYICLFLSPKTRTTVANSTILEVIT